MHTHTHIYTVQHTLFSVLRTESVNYWSVYTQFLERLGTLQKVKQPHLGQLDTGHSELTFMWEEGDSGALTNFSNKELTVGTPSTLEWEGKGREEKREIERGRERDRERGGRRERGESNVYLQIMLSG